MKLQPQITHLTAIAAVCAALGLSPLGALAAGASATTSALAFAAAPGAVESANGQLAVRHEKFRLANGFEVILVEDHRLPLIAFNLWVHAGPRNEAPGQTGFAHLFEHLMFAGTRHIPRGAADKIVEAAGGTDANGSTDFDRTNYYFTLPSNQLELGLWIKADMLGYMLDEVDAVALANQQDVVRNERRQSVENRPYGIVEEATFQALFPEGHPYRASVIGSHADIQSIKLEDVKAFSRTYYRPNNATLVLAGDFKPAEAKRLLQKYFGTLKAGEAVPDVKVAQPVITHERRVAVTDQIELSRLSLNWHTPAMYQAGDADLDLAGIILGGGKSSRLYKTLVYERQLAQSVQASQESMALGSVFAVELVARPGKSLDEIESLVDTELAALAQTPPSTEEVQRALASIETQLLSRLEKMGSLADLMNHYNQTAGDPDFVGKDLSRYRSVTPASVQAAVARFLRKDARVVVQATPGEKVLAAEVSTPPMPTGKPAAPSAAERAQLNAPEVWRMKQPKAGKALALSLPAGQRFTLPNGLTVVHVPKPGLPLASATLVLRAGQINNPAALPGLASFTASMLQEGTQTRSAQQVADEIANLGAVLSASASAEESRIELNSLKSRFKPGLALLADLALNPAFSDAEVQRKQAARLAALAQQRDDAATVASVVAARAVYGEGHPLSVSSLGDEASIRATHGANLREFWQQQYRPDHAALVIAGDVSADEARALAASLFGGWKAAVSASPSVPTSAESVGFHPTNSTKARMILVDKPGAPQTALAVVCAGPRATVPDAAAIKVMNNALGGSFTSRINQQLREVKGYTYGIYSHFNMGREQGQFGIRGSVRTDVTGAALQDMFTEIRAVRAKPLPAEEVARARNAQLLSLPGMLDTNQVVAASFAGLWALGLPEDYLVKLPAKLGAVTPASAYRAALRYVDADGLIVVAVGDQGKVLPQLQSFGRKPLELRDANGQVLK
ncbi:M16 family metallopeptidase [Roseateles koreensis]|uniref:Pitrilysin family protein n=1 Tax=Roseateles koreensis TaxID=2987526 RepID=A0ABT5KW99_9BURK|nr:pitrilysin family protein [Roseateles koreensis]MDC8787232.1 pitrilysin family protein [Roseateles koreensis]